jgi:hypothetical protein
MNKKIPLDMRVKVTQSKGQNPLECSAEEWLDLALQSEQYAKDCGVFDPSFSHFNEQAHTYFELAALREEMDGEKQCV